MSSIILVVLAVLGAYLVFALLLYFFQSNFLYFPERVIVSTPHEIGLRYEAVSFRAEDGVELSGWFVPAENPRGVVLFCHGNGGNISHRLEYIEIFHKLNLSSFLFDYRGYGGSEGNPTEEGTYLDAKAAWGYLVQKHGLTPSKIVLYGESLGGAVAAWLAQEHQPGALILASALTSVPDLAASVYPFFPVRLMSRFSYNTKEYLGRVNCPVLVIHSSEDEIVPYAHGRELYESAKGPKEFLEIRGDHNMGFVLSRQIYVNGLDSFIFKYIR